MTKREKWEWIKKHEPDLAKLILELREAGLDPQEPTIILNRLEV